MSGSGGCRQCPNPPCAHCPYRNRGMRARFTSAEDDGLAADFDVDDPMEDVVIKP